MNAVANRDRSAGGYNQRLDALRSVITLFPRLERWFPKWFR